MSKCVESQRFATELYILCSAMGDYGSKKWCRRCRAVMKRIEEVIPVEDKPFESDRKTLPGYCTPEIHLNLSTSPEASDLRNEKLSEKLERHVEKTHVSEKSSDARHAEKSLSESAKGSEKSERKDKDKLDSARREEKENAEKEKKEKEKDKLDSARREEKEKLDLSRKEEKESAEKEKKERTDHHEREKGEICEVEKEEIREQREIREQKERRELKRPVAVVEKSDETCEDSRADLTNSSTPLDIITQPEKSPRSPVKGKNKPKISTGSSFVISNQNHSTNYNNLFNNVNNVNNNNHHVNTNSLSPSFPINIEHPVGLSKSDSSLYPKTPSIDSFRHSGKSPSSHNSDIKHLPMADVYLKPTEKYTLAKANRRAGKNFFFARIQFLNEIVQISHRLTKKFGQKELYRSQLLRELTDLSQFIANGAASTIDINAGTMNMVLKILVEENMSFAIQTYERVLYFLTLEVVTIPSNITQDEALELLLQHRDNDKDKDGNDHSESEAEEKSEGYESETTVTSAFGEHFDQKVARIRKNSPYEKFSSGWGVVQYISKHGDFVLQEQFVMQLAKQFQKIFEIEGIELKMMCYTIMAITHDSGIIDVVPNAKSLDRLKQSTNCTSLLEFFHKEWPNQKDFEDAQNNFLRTLSAYSIFCYFLQIKDRHNGNIMLDSKGNLLHIDFGYLLGRTMKFEKAPFKLTEDFVEVLGGEKSKLFKKYVNYCVDGFMAIRKNYEKILLLVEMTLARPSMEGQFLPCLEKDSVIRNLRKRFRLEWNNEQVRELVTNLIREARDNWRTNIYDTYQRILNDIY